MELEQIRIKSTQFGPCGLYCGACGAEDCNGCQSDKIDEYIVNCQFRKCAAEKGIALCCYCNEYPCPDLREYMNDKWPHHRTIDSNMKQIKEHGTKKWIENQQKKWSCGSCTSRIFWYQEKCSCGQDLEHFEAPK
ncbi:DUF3795 domain-containing protein [candidate division KSB1 bacterium]